MELLNQTINNIKDLDSKMMKKSRERVDNLIKPIGSLGKLEDILIQLCGITGKLYPKVDNKAVIVMAADHGVFEESVASTPQEVTYIQTLNFARGVTGVCALAKQNNTKVIPVDIGVIRDIDSSKVINKKIRYGTANMTKGPAMTRDEAIKAIEVGIEIAQQEIDNGINLLATGEMGIANTTASTAVLSVLASLDPKTIVGVGANLPVASLPTKVNAIKKAIDINNPDPLDPIDVLHKVGGLDIAGMTGVMLAGAANRVPVVIDGTIATVSAIIASKIAPKSLKYFFPSHASADKSGYAASTILGLEPMLHMNMRLGEGSGAVLAFNIIESSTFMNKEMITFEEAGISL